MPALFRCPCGKPLQAPAGFAGRQVKCPACGRVLNIPPGGAPPAAAAGAGARPGAAPRAPGGSRAGPHLPNEAAASALRAARPQGPRRPPTLPVPGRIAGRPPELRRRPWGSLGPLLVLAAVGVVVFCGGAGSVALFVAWPVHQASYPGPRAADSQPPAVFAPAEPLPREAGEPLVVELDGAEKGPPPWFPPPGPEQERRRQARRDWLKQTTRDAYDRWGRKDPRWDGAAREALAAAEAYFRTSPPAGDEERHCHQAARRALDAGCDDPLLKYLYARASGEDTDITPAERARLFREAASALEASRYPALRRAHALVNAASASARGGAAAAGLAEARRLRDACAALLPDIAQDPNPESRVEVASICETLLQVYHDLDGDRQAGFRKIDGQLEKGRAPEALRLWVRGVFYTEYAWDARGTGVIEDVAPENLRLFHDRLREAETALTKAWELDPANARVAAAMIPVAMGLGFPRADMEFWFRRAMQADADCYPACAAKLLYLEPKWLGSEDELLAFGRECARTGNWYARLPFLLPEMHRRLAHYWKPSEGYYQRSPAAWREVRAVYGPYLERHPESRYERSVYTRLAYQCGQYAEAHKQFDLLGDQYWRTAFLDAAEYQRLRDDSARLAAAKPPARPQKPAPALPPDPNALTVDAINRTPETYLDKEVEFRALLAASVVMRGDVLELQVLNEKGAKPASLYFTTSRDLAAQWSAEGPRDDLVAVRLTCKVTQQKNGPQTVVHVTQIDLFDEQGRPGKTLK